MQFAMMTYGGVKVHIMLQSEVELRQADILFEFNVAIFQSSTANSPFLTLQLPRNASIVIHKCFFYKKELVRRRGSVCIAFHDHARVRRTYSPGEMPTDNLNVRQK